MKNIIGAVLAVLLAGGCAAVPETILEMKYTVSLHVIEVESSPETVLRISGLSGHSALAVREVTQIVKDDSLNILVHLSLANSSAARGDFVYELQVPNSVNVVSYGKDKTAIWHRPGVL